MATPIRFRLFLTCFLLIACIAVAVDFGLSRQIDNPFWRLGVELALCAFGSGAVAYLFSRSLAWRIQRLKLFADHVLEEQPVTAPLPDEGEGTEALNQSLRRMGSRIRDLVESLSLESARRDAILGSMAEGVLAVDHNHRVMFCNQAVIKILGLKQPVAEGTPLVGLSREPAISQLDFKGPQFRRGDENQAAVGFGRCADLRSVCGAARCESTPGSAGDSSRHHRSRTAGTHSPGFRSECFSRAADAF